jgi:hypothetical protein
MKHVLLQQVEAVIFFVRNPDTIGSSAPIASCPEAKKEQESMGTRLIIVALTGLAAMLLSAGGCSSDAGDDAAGESRSQAVGAACTQDSDCDGYKNPSCLTELKALASVVYADAGTEADAFRNFTLPFPGGYCTNTVENSCASDADCGAGGGCFRPFEGVSDATIAELDQLGMPFSVTDFAEVGLCLARCTGSSDCRDGYNCQVPVCALMTMFNQSYAKTFCVAPETGGSLVGNTDPTCPTPGD